jgi:gamma-glutamyltranspeptidase / glutathione hydrolase
MSRPLCPPRSSAATLLVAGLVAGLGSVMALPAHAEAQQTFRPPLHGKHWMAITGKPLAATSGAMMFQRGGNAVDAAVAMLGTTSTMWDTLGWGGETQALIFNPETGEVIGINGLGFAPTGATPEHFHAQGMHFPPEYGPEAAVIPGTPGALMVMLARFGRLSLAEVLEPSIQMADGYPIEAQTANNIERNRERLAEWTHSRRIFLPHLETGAGAGAGDRAGDSAGGRAAPRAGEIFRQPDLARTLRRLVEAEAEALARGASREEAIMAAYERFYRGDIARELVRGTQAEGGLITLEDLDRWEVKLEAPVSTTYRDIEVYKLDFWTQGPAMLQALNLLENVNLRALGFNSAAYIHTLYQAMNMAFADRDFYYGDPAFDPQTPGEGLLSKAYARARWAAFNPERNDPEVAPGDPYPFQGEVNPFRDLLEAWEPNPAFLEEDPPGAVREARAGSDAGAAVAGGGVEIGAEGSVLDGDDPFTRGTTAIQAADAEGWVVSVTPSGGWIPAFIAGETGIGLSQRMQSFVLDPRMNPYNVLEPGKRPRVTLTPSMALRDGRPFLSFAVQGGDGQDQNLLQMFLNVVEWEMTVQEAAEAPNMNSYQMRGSFGSHVAEPGRLLVQEETPSWVLRDLRRMGYTVQTGARTSGPLMGIWFDREHGTFWGGVSHHGEDHGIAW